MHVLGRVPARRGFAAFVVVFALNVYIPADGAWLCSFLFSFSSQLTVIFLLKYMC
jgi:hypothetical protein